MIGSHWAGRRLRKARTARDTKIRDELWMSFWRDSSRCPYSYRIDHVRQARVPALLGQAKRVRAHIRARQAQSQSLSLPFNSHRQPLRPVLSSFQHPADKMPTRFSKTRKQWVCPVLPLPLPLPWEKKKKAFDDRYPSVWCYVTYRYWKICDGDGFRQWDTTTNDDHQTRYDIIYKTAPWA